MNVIGLTGGSGAGKSTVARILQAHGAGWVDADAVYHRLCRENQAMLTELCAAFGDVLDADGALDRQRLASIVFASPERLAQLDALTRPYIFEACRAAFAACGTDGRRFVLFDAPTLFQSGADRLCTGGVLGVLAPREVRIARVMQRDGIPFARAAARIDAQPDEAFYRARCRWLVENNGAPEAAERQCLRLLPALLGKAADGCEP